MADNGSPPAMVLPNPLTPLALIPEDVADKLTLMIHFLVACTGIMIWDVLNYLVEDFTVIFRRKFSWRTIVFVIARIAPVGYLLLMAIFFTAKLDQCTPLHYIWVTLFVITRFSTSLLFYFRLCAIYSGNRYVISFFTFTLLFVLGGGSLTYWGTSDMHVGPTRYCVSLITSKYVSVVTVTELFNDGLTFLAIMYKLNVGRVHDGGQSWFSSLFRKPGARLTDVFTQDSQIYYIAAFAMNLAKIISFFALANPPDSPLRIVLMFPNTVVVNVMAVRVYRNMRLGRPGLYASSQETKKTTFAITKMEFGKTTEETSRTAGNSHGQREVRLPIETGETRSTGLVSTEDHHGSPGEKDLELYTMNRVSDVESRGKE